MICQRIKMDLKRGIDTAIEKVIEEIKKIKKIKTNEELSTSWNYFSKR